MKQEIKLEDDENKNTELNEEKYNTRGILIIP